MKNSPAVPAALRLTLADLHRRFGPGAVMRFDGPPLPCAAISTGFPALDAALGVGGLPRGRITDIYGPESVGKTALVLSTIAQAHRLGLPTVFIDADHALDFTWAVHHWGVNPDLFYYANPSSAESALEIAREVIRAGAGVVAIDSAAALVPQSEIMGEMGAVWGHHGRLLSEALRNLVGAVARSNTILIFTNQLRQNDSSVAGQPGPTGGYALRFYASIRLDLRPQTAFRIDGQYAGLEIRATVKKNRVAPPFGIAEFQLLFLKQEVTR